MLERRSLRDWLPRGDLTRADKVLLVLACDSAKAKSVSEICNVAATSGAPAAKRWNVSQILSRAGGCAVRTPEGWVLNKKGMDLVAALLGPAAPTARPVSSSLRAALARITDADTHAFLDEAIQCYEAKLYRAATVLSWVGAVALLYKRVVDKYLAAFNAEALRRNAKWRDAKNADGLARMQEIDFLEMAEFLGIIGKNVKEELQGCLKLRNGCGHPNTLKVAENRFAAHVETLILHVFVPFT